MRCGPRRELSLLLLLTAGCSPEAEVLPPLGEAILVVDTDAPVPKLAGRLRVDVYADDGTWLEFRDMPMRNPEDWPGSFSLYIDEGSPARLVWVRLRAYPDGKLRDYQGERFAPRPPPGDPEAPWAPPSGDGEPRLMQAGRDVTPATEPLPNLTIDRLVSVRLVDGRRASVEVKLHGACVGTMTNLYERTTCTDRENERQPVEELQLSADVSNPGPSKSVGTFAAEVPCQGEPRPMRFATDGSALYDEEVCIPGGLFFLGSTGAVISPEEEAESPDDWRWLSAIPERVAVIPPMFVDRHEVTVARWRQALQDGFVPDRPPGANEGPFPDDSSDAKALCTWSEEPRGREDFAMSCVRWHVARAFCQFHGGDLLTEAEWEYVATAAGRANETRYPWGTEKLGCEGVIFGRVDQSSHGNTFCYEAGFAFGPGTVTAGINDLSPLGVLGLGGGMDEWTLDALLPYSTNCWASAPIFDPLCWEEAPVRRVARGGYWIEGLVPSAQRRGWRSDSYTPATGFRCKRAP